MKFRYLSNILLHTITVFIFILTVYANKQRIKIGLREIDMPYSISTKQLDEYKNKLNEYFVEKTKDDEKLNKYELDFYFYPFPDVDVNGRSLIHMLMVNLCHKSLPKREYDMLVLDDRVLLNDVGLMEGQLIHQNNHFKHPSLDTLHDLTKYISKEDLEFHDPKILSGGMFENRIIGIPFEFDFDVMYYHKNEFNSNENNDIQSLLNNMENITWKELIENLKSKTLPLILSFADDDNLLNFVMEYTSNQYNLSSEYDPNYFKLFYNDTSIQYYTDLRDLIIPTIDKSRYDNNLRNIATITLDDAFYDFINNNSTFFRGKASHSILFKSNYTNDEIPLTLPPKYQSATIHKYLVANKFSKISPEILADVALVLADKDAQLFRSEIFSTIPTFDFTKKDSEEVQKYCNTNPIICNAMDKMKKLYVRDIFKFDDMITFYEIIGFIPIKFKNLFITNNVNYIKDAFKNAYEFVTNDLGPYKIFSIFITFLTIMLFVLIIYMTHKLKDHAYIKVISPIFCNLIIIGCIINLLKIFKYIPPYSSSKIKIFLILGTIGTNLIYIPMFAVAYRIFRIYKTKAFMSNSLNNKRLLICVLIAVSVSVIYNSVVAFTNRFYYITIGTINNMRFPVGYYSNYNTLNKIYQVYLTTVVRFFSYFNIKYLHYFFKKNNYISYLKKIIIYHI